MKITINSRELANNLVALAFMCANTGTDNCDLILTTSMGKISCHIEFSRADDKKTGSDG